MPIEPAPKAPRTALTLVAMLALSATVTGCFVEASASAYGVGGHQGPQLGYGGGIGLGMYLDPGPVRVALGGGGDMMFAPYRGGEAVHVGGGGTGRVDVSLVTLGSPLSPRGAMLRATAAFAYGGGVAWRPTGAAEYNGVGAIGWSAFLGPTLAAYINGLGVHFSLGGTMIYTDSRDLGVVYGIGPQARLSISFVPTGLGALFRNGYDPNSNRFWNHDVRMNQYQQGQLQERRIQQERDFQRQRERERRGY